MKVLPMVFWIADEDYGRLHYVSEAYEQVWGRSLASLYAEPASRFFTVHPQDKQHVLYGSLAAQGGKPYDGEYRILRPDGSTRWIRERIFRFREGGEWRLAGLAEDISERVSEEKRLRRSRDALAVEGLAGGAAHHYNNLLTIILCYCDLLLENKKPDDADGEILKRIAAAGRRAAGLTADLMNYSRQGVFCPVLMSLNAVIKGLEARLRVILGRDIDIQLRLRSGLGNIHADPGKLEKVILALAANARDAMPEGGCLTVETAVALVEAPRPEEHDLIAPGHYALIRVTDTGIGMGSEILSRLFEPFFTTKDIGQGMGLALAAAHGIVKQSGGAISANSEPGKGSVFTIYLPAAAESE